jgi:hypothetical protein
MAPLVEYRRELSYRYRPALAHREAPPMEGRLPD